MAYHNVIDGMRLPDTPFPLSNHLTLLTRRGSEAFGLKTPSSDPNAIDDRDLMGFVVPPQRYYTGLGNWDVIEGMHGPWDTVLYEMKKAVGLLLKQNVNTLTALWCEDDDVLVTSYAGDLLRQHRLLFRHGPMARDTFVGYAYSQLSRMTAFDRPTMERIDALERRIIDDGLDPQAIITSTDIVIPGPLDETVYEYRHLRKKYRKSYMGSKRWNLVRKIGFDAKNAGHMVRLLHMGEEYLRDGVLRIRRTWDREMLLEIKRGEWELDRIREYADQLFVRLKEMPTHLPSEIDRGAVETILMEGIDRSHNRAAA